LQGKSRKEKRNETSVVCCSKPGPSGGERKKEGEGIRVAETSKKDAHEGERTAKEEGRKGRRKGTQRSIPSFVVTFGAEREKGGEKKRERELGPRADLDCV